MVTKDAQKTISIPQLNIGTDGYFGSKINAVNETFCDIGKDGKSNCYLMLDSDVGNSAIEHTNVILMFIRNCCDYRDIIIWSDNCFKENKCFLMFSNLILIVNDNTIAANSITLKYLESGHTYMSADSLHANITKKFKLDREIYNPDHCLELIRNSRQNVSAQKISFSDIILFSDITKRVSNNTPFRIKNIKQFQVRKGSLLAYVKTDHDNDFIEYDMLDMQNSSISHINVLSNSDILSVLKRQQKPIGVSNAKYISIVSHSKRVPEKYRHFYGNLYINN